MRYKCPVCHSVDLALPAGCMPVLYSMSPIQCNSCQAQFEPNIITRLGLWVFMTVLCGFVFFKEGIASVLGKNVAGVLFLSFIGLFFLLVIVGTIWHAIKPWQFTIWNEKKLLRAVVNYGSLVSFAAYAAIFYAYRS